MHITIGGLVAVTNNWTKLYFSVWYAVGVLLLLNILTAFFLNHFAEYLRRISLKRVAGKDAAPVDPTVSNPSSVANSSPLLDSAIATDTETKGELLVEPLLTPNAKVMSPTGGQVQSPSHTSPSSSIAPISSVKRRTSLYTEFNNSIFASEDDRTKLVEWFSTHDPALKSASVDAVGKSSGESTVPDSSTQELKGNDQETHRVTLQTPFTERRSSLKRPSYQESDMKTPARTSQAVVVPSIAEETNEKDDDDDDDDSFVDEEIDEEIFVDMDKNFQTLLDGALMNYCDENSSISLSFSNSKMKVKSLRSSITSASDGNGAALDDASLSTKERRRSGLKSMFRSRGESILYHERNVQKNMESHHLSAGYRFRTKKAVLDWMYGVNQISRIERAAVLIQFARDGEESSVFSSERSLACYKMRSKYASLFKAAPFAFVLLRFFERPLWTFYHTEVFTN